jgi:hypothetical protein
VPYRIPPPYREIHQARRRVPSAYEDQLADALEVAFGEKAWELPRLVERLNSLGSTDPNGVPWTAESFRHEISVIAASAAHQEVSA